MRKGPKVTAADRRLIRLVNPRLLKKMTWAEIGIDLGKDGEAIYQRLYRRTKVNPDGTLIAIDEVKK